MSSAKQVMAISRFKGVDLAGNETMKSPSRASWSLNMITDGNGYPETRKGYEKLLSADGRINGIYRLVTSLGDKTIVHHGTRLSEWTNGTLTELYSGIADVKSTARQLDNKLLILDGYKALVYANWGDENEPIWEVRTAEDESYVPTVVISAKNGATPGGTPYEGVNLINDYQINDFLISDNVFIGYRKTPTGGTYDWNPACVLVCSDAPVSDVTVQRLGSDGFWTTVSASQYTVNALTGTIKFTAGETRITADNYETVGLYATPVTGRDNYRVKFKSSHSFASPAEQEIDNPEYEKMGIMWPAKNAYATTAEWGLVSARRAYAAGTAYAAGDMVTYSGSLYKVKTAVTEDENTDWSAVKAKFQEYWSYASNWYYSFRLKFNDVDWEKPFYFIIKKMGVTSYNQALQGRHLLPQIPLEFPRYYDMSAKNKGWIYIDHDSSGSHDEEYQIYYRRRQVGDDWYIDLVMTDTAIWYGGGSFTAYNGFYEKIYTVALEYTRATSSYADRINHCTVAMPYGYAGNNDRLFLTGNSDVKNYDFWSDINNPLYFPDLNFARVGDEASAVMGYSWLSDGSLAIHKEFNGEDSTIYIRQGTTYNGEVVFTLKQGAVGMGAVSKRCGAYVNGEPLQLSAQGVFATVPISNVAFDERNAQGRSYFINPMLIKQDLGNAEAIAFNNKYYLAAGEYVFVADTAQKAYTMKGDQYCYEWYLWNNVPVRVWYTDGYNLYFGDDKGNIFVFADTYEDDGNPVEWEWTTPWLDFGRQTYFKKIKNVTLLTASRLWQNPNVEYRFPRKSGKSKAIGQYNEQEAPYLKGTGYKAKKVDLMQIHIYGERACGISALNILYTVSGKIK